MSKPLIAINKLVNTAPNDAMSEIFVIEAIRYYSELILQNNRPLTPGDGLYNQQTWWDTAAHSHEFLERTFGNKDGSSD